MDPYCIGSYITPFITFFVIYWPWNFSYLRRSWRQLMYCEKNRNVNAKLVCAENVNMHNYRLLVFDQILSLMIMTTFSLNHHFLKKTLQSFTSATTNEVLIIIKKYPNKSCDLDPLPTLTKKLYRSTHLSHYYYHKPFNAEWSCSTQFQISSCKSSY